MSERHMVFVGIERPFLIFGRHDFATTLIFRQYF